MGLMAKFREANRPSRKSRPQHRRFFEPGVGWREEYNGPAYDEMEMVG